MIRTSHYPNDELFLDLCDEQGILVWEESHARGLKEYHMPRIPIFRSSRRLSERDGDESQESSLHLCMGNLERVRQRNIVQQRLLYKTIQAAERT